MGNRATDVGGGILNRGTLAIRDSLIRRNRGLLGGGIGNEGGELDLRRTRVARNSDRIQGGGGTGGGIWNAPGSSLTLVDSVFARNTAFAGAGIDNWAVLELVGSSVRRNRALDPGGGIWNEPERGTVTLDATSSVTGNTPEDCVGTTAC